VSDPVRDFEHSHEHLTKLARDAGRLVRMGTNGRAPEGSTGELRQCLEALRDELLQHFAVEEEGLFPFIRSSLPSKVDQVERLALTHDTLAGAVVRLAHAVRAEGSSPATLEALYDRFETTYALHSREEADLLAELGRTLDTTQRTRLRELLNGL
jgi:iron-sulfur cluster repair protein YtfE (RIC family)